MVESHIDIQRVVPTSWKHSPVEGQISSDSDDDINILRVVNSFQHDSYNNFENVKITTETTALKKNNPTLKHIQIQSRHIHPRYAKKHSTVKVTGDVI